MKLVADAANQSVDNQETMMHRDWGLGIVVISTAMISCACHLFGPSTPSTPVTGAWFARGNGITPNYYYLSLQQNGDDITGTMCHIASSLLRPDIKAAPVNGKFPYVRWVVTEASGCNVPLCAGIVGFDWSGRVDGTGDIVAATAPDNELRFKREQSYPAVCLSP